MLVLIVVEVDRVELIVVDVVELSVVTVLPVCGLTFDIIVDNVTGLSSFLSHLLDSLILVSIQSSTVLTRA